MTYEPCSRSHRHDAALLMVTFACVLTGCPSEVSGPDAGVSHIEDAGTSTDGGQHGDDAGTRVEDGGTSADAGEVADAGGHDDGGSTAYPADAGVYDGDYWEGVDEALTDQALVDSLHARLVETHIQISYDDLYNAYLSTDGNVDGCAGIFDFYSDVCWAPEDSCGQYNEEGDCYNREHSWPKSWWGGSASGPQYSDLFHVVPADGYVNNQRGNYPLGVVTDATYTSSNGSKVGDCAQPEAGGTCFEPIDALKGDFARIYFYMAVRYEGELGCCDEVAVSGADLKSWEEALMRQWHALDPVDDTERARNEAVFVLQGGRNPFVDDPYRVERISDF